MKLIEKMKIKEKLIFFLEVEQEVKNKHIYDFFRKLWNENEITICYNLLLEMSKCRINQKN